MEETIYSIKIINSERLIVIGTKEERNFIQSLFLGKFKKRIYVSRNDLNEYCWFERFEDDSAKAVLDPFKKSWLSGWTDINKKFRLYPDKN